jgi:translation initiation factor 1 (eIF-1/SUI1)
MSESIKLVLKQKSVSTVVEFCLEERIEFQVRPQGFPDNDWEVNLLVNDIKTAVTTGMFLRENRIEMPGDQQKTKKTAPRKGKDEEDKVLPTQGSEDVKTSDTEEKGLF